MNYERRMRINRIFHKAPDDLLIEDYKNLPELRPIIKVHLEGRGLEVPKLTHEDHKMKCNRIRCGRCGKTHNVGSKKFKYCSRVVRNKIAKGIKSISIKGSGIEE